MESHYASPERASIDRLRHEISLASSHPVMGGLLSIAGGMLAILNQNRQVVAVNDTFLRAFGIDDAAGVLGLRPGEVLNCEHAFDMPAGCGTSELCASCGAAIAIVTSLVTDSPVERKCCLTTITDGEVRDLYFAVRCCPVSVDGARFVVLFLEDISKHQEWQTMERVFYHDLANIVSGLVAESELASAESKSNELVQQIYGLSLRLREEIDIHRAIFDSDDVSYPVVRREVKVERLVRELWQAHTDLASAKGLRLTFPVPPEHRTIVTDQALVMRVLGNMIINAIEAATHGTDIRFDIDYSQQGVTFSVWNDTAIPTPIQRRIFQRNFSTKDGLARGLGTYSMKLLGEKVLGGRVWFDSSLQTGTTFCLHLPLSTPEGQ